jgi:hypothetical protein
MWVCCNDGEGAGRDVVWHKAVRDGCGAEKHRRAAARTGMTWYTEVHYARHRPWPYQCVLVRSMSNTLTVRQGRDLSLMRHESGQTPLSLSKSATWLTASATATKTRKSFESSTRRFTATCSSTLELSDPEIVAVLSARVLP